MSKKQIAMIMGATPSIKRLYVENKTLLKKLRAKRNQLEIEMEIELEELNIDEYYRLKNEYCYVARKIMDLDKKETVYIKAALKEFKKVA